MTTKRRASAGADTLSNCSGRVDCRVNVVRPNRIHPELFTADVRWTTQARYLEELTHSI